MFSEYASKFLAQSQSRISFHQPEESPRNPLSRASRQDRSRLGGARPSYARPAAGNPYLSTASPFSQFPFASRSPAPSAPLFYSATDDFREEDDEEEHEKEVADFYALQRSRRQFVESRLEESSEGEDEGSRGSGLGQSGDGRDIDERGTRVGGIRSSWKGGRLDLTHTRDDLAPLPTTTEHPSDTSDSGGSPSKGKGKMVDIALSNRNLLRSSHLDSPPEDLLLGGSNPPSIQHLKSQPPPLHQPSPSPFSQFLPRTTSDDVLRAHPPPPESDTSSTPPTLIATPSSPRHDAFWSTFYLVSLSALFASFALIYLHTSAPSKKHPLGDTIYTTLHGSFHLLATDTLVSILVSLLWLALLRSYVRPLIYTILISVPIILTAFSIVPLVSSFRGRYGGNSVQDRAMRWLSVLPFTMALAWLYGVYTARHALSKAIGILDFATRILAANPALLVHGFAHLLVVVSWTWLWMGMFTRVFLGGHFSSTSPKSLFIIDAGTWWLAVFFILQYLWTLGVNTGVQRATTAATVSQWYFHRLASPAPTSAQVVRAALSHSLTTLFGTVCLSSLLALMVRLPLLVLPRRITAFVGFCTAAMLPSSVATLTHPLALTHAAIHSQPLSVSAHALASMPFILPSAASAGNAHGGRRGGARRESALVPYHLALLLLHSTRLIASFAFGFGAWVNTARSLALIGTSGGTVKGSLYAYVVGLIAGTIGWAVLGAMEGVLAGVVDAAVVCWGSEVAGGGEARYCREAGGLFGGEAGVADEEAEGLMRI